MVDSDSVDAALNSIAMKFEGQYQTEAEDSEVGGWGQFLDGPRPHRQIGLYGTAAGLLVLSLADRTDTPCTCGATKLLHKWWREWRDSSAGYAKTKFCQNLRLAFSALCLRNTHNDMATTVAREIENEMLRRVGSRGRWGDYWVNPIIQDVAPRYLATALTTLSLSVFGRPTDPVALAHIEHACAFLEQTLATNSHLTATEKGVIAAAILAASGTMKSRKAVRIVTTLAQSPESTLAEHHSYFYEYRFDGGGWDRDSIYLYGEIMIGIAGFLRGAPPELRLRGERTLVRVLENISGEGFHPAEGVGRISTVEQAWCCLFLALAKQSTENAVSRPKNIKYALIRNRHDTLFTRTVIPLVAILMVTYAMGLRLDSTAWIVFKGVASFIVFSLYGPSVIKRFFPGR